jgi:hypothetical protein
MSSEASTSFKETFFRFFDKISVFLDPIFGKSLFIKLIASALIAQGVLIILFHNDSAGVPGLFVGYYL